MNQLAALYRSPTYSPNDHRCNDSAILEATAEELARRGWSVVNATEPEIERGNIPDADLYLNMCQGRRASEMLAEVVGSNARIVNRPTSVLNCHRRRLVESIMASGVPFPQTLIAPTTDGTASTLPIDLLTTDHDPIWVKRGDVHAERNEDVVVTDRDGIAAALAAFRKRGIGWAALQANVPGPIIKFYGVAGRDFFRWYLADTKNGTNGKNGHHHVEVDVEKLEDLAFRAAQAVGLEIFGGDVALPAPDQPVLIDLNDWPSFARVRQDAAKAIAQYAEEAALIGKNA
jgi:hypothetical protein